jgi:hypothetical protein
LYQGCSRFATATGAEQIVDTICWTAEQIVAT